MAALDNMTPSHNHLFLGDDHHRNERRVWLVIALTVSAMAIEIVAGQIYGSMALTADGWHMSTHAAAMLISALAYFYARRHARDPRFSFGAGKFGDLAGFASAIVLALVALLIAWDSILRLLNPTPISFAQAIAVAVFGLIVNLVCAWLLRDEPHGHDHHRHGHHHHDHGAGRDNNLRAAYLHVLADALTSALAIAALLLGGLNGWVWADPAMGVVGGLVIARWSWGLIRDAGGVLLDRTPDGDDLPGEIRQALENHGDRLTDLHVWRIGPGHYAAIISIASTAPKPPSRYKAMLAHIHELSHVTIEVEAS